jgi:hypothetical protein
MIKDERTNPIASTAKRVAIRRRMPILAGLAGAACLAFTATAASASADHAKRVQVIHVDSTLTSATLNSAGLGGPGDVAANLNVFSTSNGVTGHADITCQFFPNNERECTASFVFPDGQIDASAALVNGATMFTAPITGGSGAFEGVSGHVDNLVDGTVTHRTLYLIYPHGR